ncbi:Hint domain-containing protein [Lutimaribacter marinistellae]|uniref:Hint domain-containing protein n=1 Tax=Lutimaribacter marinistellae TaxID=1820329 RepID=A0ABV7TIG7_9RHOB
MKPNTVGREGGRDPLPFPPAYPDVEIGCPAMGAVLTLDGEMPAEHLFPGDRVITRDAGAVTLKDLQRVTLRTRAIRLSCGLILPAAQPVLLRDWRAKAMFKRPQARVMAGDLVDGEFIRDLGHRTLDLVQLHFDSPHILYCNGVELSSAALPARMRPAA